MKISFCGGAREVTGACYLFENTGTRILIDCGLHQGRDECPEDNFAEFPFDPKTIDALFVTHAHLDHIGRIPKLVREGFSGSIYSTPPTRDLAQPILEDAMKIAGRADGTLYSEEDLARTFSLWEVREYHVDIFIGTLRARLQNAGHILGSAMVEFAADGKRILFSGDLGNAPSTLLPNPDAPHAFDYLVIESTYGGRTHEDPAERVLALERAVEDAASRRGALLIPAFATERTQDILFLLNEMVHLKRVPEIPVFVDSPLAIRITEIFERYPEYYKKEIQELYRAHPHLFRFKRLRFTESAEESKSIRAVPPPKAILAGSGMMHGGRILHHAKDHIADEKSVFLIVGYQAGGSLGRRLVDGAAEVTVLGETIPVRAEIRQIKGFSAHADNPQLFSFVENTKDMLRHVFVVQGEEASAIHFAQEIRDRLGIPADAPVQGQEFVLE